MSHEAGQGGVGQTVNEEPWTGCAAGEEARAGWSEQGGGQQSSGALFQKNLN